MMYRYELSLRGRLELIDDHFGKPKLSSEVQCWMKENIGWLRWRALFYAPRIEDPRGYYILRFLTQEDAMAFKLRWG